MTDGQNNPPIRRRRKQRRRFSWRKTLRLFVPIFMFIGLCMVMCVPTGEKPVTEDTPVLKLGKNATVHDLEVDTVSRYLYKLDSMPEPTQRIKVNYFGNLRPFFNDSNYVHWAEAEKIGIQPLTDTRSHWQLKRPIVKVTTCLLYTSPSPRD